MFIQGESMSLEKKIENLKKKIEEQKQILSASTTLLELTKQLFKLNLQYRVQLAKAEGINEVIQLMFKKKEKG